MTDTITLHCITCAREFTIPREEYDKDEFRLYCPACRLDSPPQSAGDQFADMLDKYGINYERGLKK